MTNTETTVTELKHYAAAQNAVTLAVAYNAYIEASKAKDEKLEMIWGEMVVAQCHALGITSTIFQPLEPIRQRAKSLRQVITGMRS